MSSNARKWTGIVAMVVCYYLVHEGAHCIAALCMGTFEGVQISFPGMQVLANTSAMTDWQIAVFCLVGALATLMLGYLLVLLTKRILRVSSKLFKAVLFYITLGLLLTDPIYLSLLCSLFGGGDMNGIVLFGIPELAARSAFAIVGMINVFLFAKCVYPAYKKEFSRLDGSGVS